MTRLLVTAVIILSATGSRADDGCQRALPPAARQFLGRSLAALADCHERIARGSLPAGTDCVVEPTTVRRRAVATTRLRRRIRKRCTDADAASLMAGGDCLDARTAAALATCVGGSHAADAAAVIAVTDATPGRISAAARRCHAEASRSVRHFTVARLRILGTCKRRPPADLPPGTDCGADPRTAARIAALRRQTLTKIARRCRDAGAASASFGPPCTTLAGKSLAQCLLAVAETAGDEAIMAEFRDRGFCGDAAEAVERRIDELLARLTLAEKLEQMHGSRFADNAWRTPGNERLGIPGLGMIDGPRGVSVFAGHATAFPVAIARGATWDPVLEERVGEAIGAEARAKGASVLLAPVLNIVRHPRGGRTQESYGEDTVHLGRMGVGFIRGAQRHVIASAKHFAANNIENTRTEVDVSIDERTLREVYLPHFRRAVQEAHAGSVMAAYNRVNGQYCAENVHLLHDILKGDWGFQGFVESDWILGTRSTVPSVNAGLDIEMPSPVFYGQPLAEAVAAGAVPEAAIDAAVRRILRAQLCFRLDTDPPSPDPSQVETPAHADLALEVARKGIVLLRNERGTLPLSRSAVRSIAVVGTLATMANLGDRGSSSVAPSVTVAPLDGIRARAGDIVIDQVSTTPLSASDQATVAAADAAVVVAGLSFHDEGEGQVTPGDRTGLGLPGDQDQLIASVAALNPRTIVVLEGSGAVLMPWVNDVAAILMAWYPGQAGGTAIAEVLFGDVTPSGKLPMTFPHAEQDLPPFDNQSLTVTYDYFHGYRYLDKQALAPLFPFGFGLSYTTFAYANLVVSPPTLSRTDRVHLTAEVTNTGPVAGDEVAQLYVGYQSSRVDRAVRDLKAFARIHLEPGQTQTVSFDLHASDLAFWDDAAGGWEVEPITYAVQVGSSSRDLPLTGTFAVAP
jgi:beta-glucosidase